ncbi:glycosyltransferase [Dyadobacter sp. CY356]|uniref:glycosyltransferase n=1 Tax=Dyadobacter sp. CY356 TaxID=2906442 RepID=UPI001F2310A0|nr:glycosyltransferase [Dyadobacter sp. CY356]MCF0054160.1 glycosyltransferase [Dyadobacter sp. CY356]
MKKILLFYPANIQSHVIPAMNLASHLKNEYEIYVLVMEEKLADIVRSYDFHPIMISPFKVGIGQEAGYLKEKGRKYTLWHILLAMHQNVLFHDKIDEFASILGHLKPAAVIVDIFNSTELFPLHVIFPQTALVCFNPMLSTYKVGGFPTVSERSWSTANTKDYKIHQMGQVFQGWTTWIGSLFRWVYANQLKKLLVHSKLGEKNRMTKNATYTILFDNIPEVLLAPLELELSPKIKLPPQHYLGLCLNKDRVDLGVDEGFNEWFQRLLYKKKKDVKIIYCSFGTFYVDSNPMILQFLNNLLTAIANLTIPVEFIFSIKTQIKQTLLYQRQLAPNVHFFAKVPQLQVLENADLHITHGGLGSIKESIYYEVPMLVYPLDLVYDQNGNGLKVEHHGLGLRGVFNQDKPPAITEKIIKLLEDKTFHETIEKFNHDIEVKYAGNFIIHTIDKLISQHESI